MAANDDLLDALVRRQIDTLRFSRGLAKRVIGAIDSSERSIAALIRERMESIGKGARVVGDSKLKRLASMIKQVRKIRGEFVVKARKKLEAELFDLIDDEAKYVKASILEAVGIAELTVDVPSARKLNAATFKTPYGGRKFSQWFKGLQGDDVQRIEDAIRAGFFEGEGAEQIVRRVRGTTSLGGADGITQVTRNSTRTLVRTTVNAFENSTREAVFAENSDIIGATVWVSTLDGRTSAICRARDGNVAPIEGKQIPEKLAGAPLLEPPSARPPAHPNCRSMVTAVLDGEGIVGKRPFVTDTRTRRKRETDFRRQSRDSGRSIQDIRRQWADENVGRLPAKVNYQQFLGRQKAGFQDEVLGKTKGALFRRGGLTLKNFVDTKGREFTISDLRTRHPGAFVKANLS